MQKRIVIGLVGETGGGKDDFCNYLKRNYKDVFCFRFSDPLTEILKVIFNDIRKEDEQWLALVLRKKFGSSVLAEDIKRKVKNIKAGIICINGVRFWDDYQMVRELGGKVVYITAKPKIRWQRIRKRSEKEDDNVSYRKFLKIEKAKTEILIPEIGKKRILK